MNAIEKNKNIVRMKWKLNRIREITNRFELAIIDEDEIGMANELVYLNQEICRVVNEALIPKEVTKGGTEVES